MREGFNSIQCPSFGGPDVHPVGRTGVHGVFVALAVMLALSACGASNDGDESNKINGSIHVPAGKRGELRFERPVKLFVSDKATIGTVTGATPIPFSGESPPT